MTEPVFDHEKLDVYRLSIEYGTAQGLKGANRHIRDQWLRAAQSIPLNIAEGNGKQNLKDKNHYFQIARGSALECAAVHDILTACDVIDPAVNRNGKSRLKRIVSMLTRLIQRSDRVAPDAIEYEYSTEVIMTEPVFDHEKLDVYRLSIQYVADSYGTAKGLKDTNRHIRDQWLRAAQSIPLNIAGGNGKQNLKDKNHYFQIARGSALECAAVHDILTACDVIDPAVNRNGPQRTVSDQSLWRPSGNGCQSGG
ncbi:MAG: four helix bundle protein [Pirellulales bacterium]